MRTCEYSNLNIVRSLCNCEFTYYVKSEVHDNRIIEFNSVVLNLLSSVILFNKFRHCALLTCTKILLYRIAIVILDFHHSFIFKRHFASICNFFFFYIIIFPFIQ